MTLKDINFNIAMYGTEPVVQSTYSVVYTGDESSVKVNFNVTDDEADLTGATAKVHLYFADSSHIERDAQIDGTVVHYTLKGTENDHAGPVRVDVFITMNGATYTRAGYKFRIDASLEASAPLVEYAIETLDTVVKDADEWLAQAQTDFGTAQNQRAAEWVADNDMRDDQFTAAQVSRTESFGQSETARTAAFNTSETGRSNTFTTNENARQAAADANETARNNSYTVAENNREERYGIAESNRSETADADHTRAVGDHNTATADHGIAESDHVTATADHENYAGLLEDGVLTTQIVDKLTKLETTYAPDLVSVKQQLAEAATKAELSAIATPKAVTLIAEMTDVAKIYVYTGVEGGYVAGNWYYHNGTAWTSGGVYQATGLTDESVTAQKLNKETKPTYKITDVGVGSFLTPARIPEYDVNTNIVVIQENGAAGLAWINVTKNDKIIKGKLDANIGIYWGKGIILTDLNNRYVRFWDVPYITTNALPFVVYDAETRYFTIDVVSMLASYPATKRIFVVYTAEFAPELTKTLDYSDLKFLAPIPIDEELVLPSVIPCVVGHEMNCYWENALLYGRMNAVQKIDTEYTLDASERLTDRFVWKPVTSNITAMKVMLWKKSLKQYDDAKVVSFKAVSATAGTGTKKVLVIGDSKTAYGQVVRKLKALFDTDTTMDIEYLGTRYDNNNTGDVTYKHEGRGGWSVSDYVRVASKDGLTNPFYNVSTFDFPNYMTTQAYASVDYVIINLSTNDQGRLISDVVADLNTMIASIKAFNSTIKVIVCLTEGVYRNKMEWDTRNTWYIELKKLMIATYDKREAEKIYVCPLYLNMDLYEDYNLTSVPLSSEDTTKTRLMTADGIHQNQAGFNKNANTMYYTMKYIESLG